MKLGYTDITVILDKSGSMYHTAKDTVGGINQFIKSQSELPGECTMSIVQFASPCNLTSTLVENIQLVKPLINDDTYRADGGSTALLDAIGKTLESVGNRYSEMAEEDRPEKVLIVIMTDGEENSSCEFTREAIFDKITHQREKYNWEFIFLGANQDAIKAGSSLGISAKTSMSYAQNSEGISLTASSLSNTVTQYRSCRSLSEFTGFSDSDRMAQKKNGAM